VVQPTKGFGLIAPDDGSADGYAHFSSIEGSGYRELIEGQKVDFEAERDPKGLQAKAGPRALGRDDPAVGRRGGRGRLS